ncbi:hypothetical protein KI387_025001, partial [Taxus chinensis]
LNNNARFQCFNCKYTTPMPFAADLNLNLTAVCREGWLKEVLHILLTIHNLPEDSSAYLQLLQTCIAQNGFSQDKQIHSLVVQWSFAFAPHSYFQNNLINMYAKCGSLVNARTVFDYMTERDVSSWNIIIAAYRRHGFPQEALTPFHQMQRTGLQPDQFTFASILPACAEMRALKQGMGIHQSIMERGFSLDVVVASALVDMYAKCGSIHKAREISDKMPQKTEVSWNGMITAFAQSGFFEKALDTFTQIQLAGVKPVSLTFVSILPVCAKMGALEH